MTITAYYPVFHVNDIDSALKQYTEEMGFTQLHKMEDGVVISYVLEINGYRMEIIHLNIPQFKDRPDGFLAMRVNVREMDEAIAFYQAHGYTIMEALKQDKTHSFTAMANKDGNIIFLSHHFREDER